MFYDACACAKHSGYDKIDFLCTGMSLFIASLNSGSNGNCYYIGNSTDAVLIDAGISCRETEKRMKLLGLNIKKVRAIFVSHEHIDHVKGIPVIAGKHNLPVFITRNTAAGVPGLKKHSCKTFIAGEQVMIGELSITPFTKKHDAADPHSFLVSYDRIHVGVLTDIGKPCKEVIRHFKKCHAAFLETNYDTGMLENGKYPYHLKRRISSNHGHLSNQQALELFLKHRSPALSHLLLSHLSKENNSPELVKELFAPHANGTEIIIASRYEQSAVYQVSSPENRSRKPGGSSRQLQLGLFG